MKIVDCHDQDFVCRKVWLNFRDVSNKSFRGLMPEKPGRLGLGWLDMYKVKEDGYLDLEKSYRAYGLVKWEQLPVMEFRGLEDFRQAINDSCI